MLGGRLTATGLGLLLALTGVLSGCGRTPSGEVPGSDQAKACRAQWGSLGQSIRAESAQTLPSALPERWNAIAATVDYNRTSASGKDCAARLDAQRKAIVALKAFGARLAAYDMQARLAQVEHDATAYAAGPWPAAPHASPAPKGKKRTARPARPPKPSLVGAALRTLSTQAPVATAQQGPGWQQASVTDLGDRVAMAKAAKDLRFLSTESPAWRACASALVTIRAGLAAKS